MLKYYQWILKNSLGLITKVFNKSYVFWKVYENWKQMYSSIELWQINSSNYKQIKFRLRNNIKSFLKIKPMSKMF